MNASITKNASYAIPRVGHAPKTEGSIMDPGDPLDATGTRRRARMNVMSKDDIRKIALAYKSFDALHTISDIILLGEDGACTRIIIGEPKNENQK